MRTALIFVLCFGLLFPQIAVSHSGGLNAQGSHAGSKPYHCHRSQGIKKSLRVGLFLMISDVRLNCFPRRDKYYSGLSATITLEHG